MKRSYYTPRGGLPDQTRRLYAPAIFTEAYAVIPAHSLSDIVTSNLPGWRDARAWILARPLSGFAETFAQLIVELAPGGGSDAPEPDPAAECVLFVTDGAPRLTLEGESHALGPGSFVYIPPGASWQIANPAKATASFHWIRKAWEGGPGLSPPPPLIARDADTEPEPMPGTDLWATTRFTDAADLSHDMQVNIVTFRPGGVIPFAETHVMEHGIFILQGTARYLLNTDWVDVGPGDFLWLRAFCPQACEATGTEPFRYLLYKDINRHPKLRIAR